MNTYIEQLKARFAQNKEGIFHSLNFELMEIVGEKLSLTIRAEKWAVLSHSEPEIHTGLITLLLDSIFGFAVMANLKEPAAIATINLNINFIESVEIDSDFRIEVEVVEINGSIAIVQGDVLIDSTGTRAAYGNGSFMIGTKGPSLMNGGTI